MNSAAIMELVLAVLAGAKAASAYVMVVGNDIIDREDI